MTVKIITHGSLPEEVTYDHHCTYCRTHFEFQRKDARLSSDQRDGNLMIIACPMCKRDCYKTP